ncbi:metallophosphoesterase family protein [Gephyromycinifex aptenodytis]|uniref:metallophosphoesterase family protein n=1 Tax=Gephyromycinifex aptenodytis TaxID=2716227 RepID=UPI001445CC63|nr:metallophosphoesterase [Gephyromycinifex aptenodytis]
MASVRFLQTSDWQLGMTRHFLRPEAQARYTAARIDAIHAMAGLAGKHACDFVVVAGDVFESNLIASQTIRRAMQALAEMPCPVYLLPGNHDPLDAASVYDTDTFTACCPENVVVLRQPGPYVVSAGVEILAAPWATKNVLGDLAARALSGCEADGTVRLLLAHGIVDVLSPDPNDVSMLHLEAMEQALGKRIIHHVALGDRHSRLSVGVSGRVWYSGSPEVTSFVEDAPGEVLIVEMDSAGGHTVQSEQVGTWSFVDLRRHVDTSADLEALQHELAGLRPADRTVVRTALTGTLRLADKARLEQILAEADDLFAGRFTWDRHEDLAVIIDEAELGDLGVGGFASQAAQELAELAAGSGEQAVCARDALSLLYRLAGGGVR